MRMIGWPIAWSLFVFAASLGALVVLQRLRTQPTLVRVPTVMFWREALGRDEPRVWGRRWRRPLTFLLLALIAGLLSLMLSAPVWSGGGVGGATVLLMEAGLAMRGDATGGGSRLSEARQRVLQWIDGSEGAGLAVIVADPWPRVIKGVDEGAAVARVRLAQLQASALAADSRGAVMASNAWVRARGGGRLVWITSAGADELARVESHLSRRARDVVLEPWPVGGAASNGGIVSIGVVPDASNPLRGDLRVRVGHWGAAPREVTLEATRAGTAEETMRTTLELPANGTTDWIVEDVALDGRTMGLRLSADDALPDDDEASYTLPRRAAVRVATGPGLQSHLTAAVRALVEAIPGEIVSGDAPAAVTLTGDEGGEAQHRADERPRIVLVRRGAAVDVGSPIYAVNGESTKDSDPALTGRASEGPVLTRRQGPTRWEPLLRVEQGPVAVVGTDVWGRDTLWLSVAVVGEGALAADPAIALILARAIRGLAGWQDALPSLTPTQVVEDPSRVAAVRTGAMAVAPGDRNVSDTWTPQAPAVQPPVAGGSAWPLYRFGLYAALLLLMVEFYLHARQKIA